MKKFLVLLPFVLAATVQCTTPGSPAAKPLAFVTDSSPASAAVDLQEVALTFPQCFENPDKEAVRRNLDSYAITRGPDRWSLAGDGAQHPVTITRLTAEGVSPVRIRIVTGPSETDPRKDDSTYERTETGWKLLEHRRY
jgi:hypothetical protein